MKFLIDHAKQTVHRTTFANDNCRFYDTKAEEREFSESISYIEELIGTEKYTECQYCHKYMMKPDINDL